jgi:mevalonate kinase
MQRLTQRLRSGADLLAEMCDEESAILQDYFEFPAETYRSVRERAMENGALGGKVVGAGGGGFLMLYCEEGRQKVRTALAAEGLVELRFGFDYEGSKVIYNI